MDIPIEEVVISDEDDGWGDMPFDISSNEKVEWDNTWNLDEEEIIPIMKGDLYILLLETKEKPILCNVETINESSETI